MSTNDKVEVNDIEANLIRMNRSFFQVKNYDTFIQGITNPHENGILTNLLEVLSDLADGNNITPLHVFNTSYRKFMGSRVSSMFDYDRSSIFEYNDFKDIGFVHDGGATKLAAALVSFNLAFHHTKTIDKLIKFSNDVSDQVRDFVNNRSRGFNNPNAFDENPGIVDFTTSEKLKGVITPSLRKEKFSPSSKVEVTQLFVNDGVVRYFKEGIVDDRLKNRYRVSLTELMDEDKRTELEDVPTIEFCREDLINRKSKYALFLNTDFSDIMILDKYIPGVPKAMVVPKYHSVDSETLRASATSIKDRVLVINSPAGKGIIETMNNIKETADVIKGIVDEMHASSKSMLSNLFTNTISDMDKGTFTFIDILQSLPVALTASADKDLANRLTSICNQMYRNLNMTRQLTVKFSNYPMIKKCKTFRQALVDNILQSLQEKYAPKEFFFEGNVFHHGYGDSIDAVVVYRSAFAMIAKKLSPLQREIISSAMQDNSLFNEDNFKMVNANFQTETRVGHIIEKAISKFVDNICTGEGLSNSLNRVKETLPAHKDWSRGSDFLKEPFFKCGTKKSSKKSNKAIDIYDIPPIQQMNTQCSVIMNKVAGLLVEILTDYGIIYQSEDANIHLCNVYEFDKVDRRASRGDATPTPLFFANAKAKY